MHIEVKHLQKSFGSFHSIRDISFEVAKGKLVGLLGPSGGGKTSILRLLAGLESPDSGDILLNGVLANPLPVQKRGIGFVFQSYALFKHMTVFDNVAYGLRVKKEPRSAIQDRVLELLERMGLEGSERKYPHQLSGGQRQRVAFARALAPEPQLLLLDEPFAAIDAQIRKELRLWLRGLIDQFGVTTLFVTHDQEEAIEVADEIILVRQGRIEQQGSPWDIYTKPASAFVASFIGEMNRLAAPLALRGFEQLERFRNGEEWQADTAVMLRPEAIELRPYLTRQWAEASEFGVVRRVHFRGDAWYVDVEVKGCSLFAYLPANELILRPGDSVKVLIRELAVFTPEKRIRFTNQAMEDPMPVSI